VSRFFSVIVSSVLIGERVAFFPDGTTAAQGTVLPFHANLFEAAIEAQVPVQAYALRYLHDDGALHGGADFVGDMNFAQSVAVILQSPRMTAELIRLPALPSAGAHRRELALAARAAIASALNPVADMADSPPATTNDLTSALP
jgi:1-acyl-sn-glycerol-3-phosphate acyltransferase